MMVQDAGKPGACQNWEQGCGDCELNSEPRAWGKSSLGEGRCGMFSEQWCQDVAFKVTDIKYLSCVSGA